jgi:hypothetical protein
VKIAYGGISIFVEWTSVRASVRFECAGRPQGRAALVLACHSRATEDGQARSLGNNYGQLPWPLSWSWSLDQLERIPECV